MKIIPAVLLIVLFQSTSFGQNFTTELDKANGYQDRGTSPNLILTDSDYDILLSSQGLFTERYYPMAIDGANWVYARYEDDLLTGYYGWHIDGDTIIEGTAYKNVYRLSVTEIVTDIAKELSYELASENPAFFMRDDTISRKVFIKEHDLEEWDCEIRNSEAELELYDFGIAVGDTVALCENTANYPIQQVNTVDAYGYLLPYYPDLLMYQQIGRSYGLLGEPILIIVPGYGTSLVAYCVSDDLGCPYYTGPTSTKSPIRNHEVSISPNPAQDYFSIYCDDCLIDQVEIRTAAGTLIQQQSAIGTSQLLIDVSLLSTGVYIVQTISGESISVKKILIQK